MVHPTNHIWRISNRHYALSVSWFTLRTIFSELVIYAVILSLNLYGISIDNRFYPFFVVHGSPYEISGGVYFTERNGSSIKCGTEV